MPTKEPGQQQPSGPPEITQEAVAALYAEFREADDDGASSNDITQMLDDWFTRNGWPTVLYRQRPGRR